MRLDAAVVVEPVVVVDAVAEVVVVDDVLTLGGLGSILYIYFCCNQTVNKITARF